MSGQAVRVAVRVRPFNQREKDRNATLIIGMNENGMTTITNPQTGAEKSFTYDFSYWSHDGYETMEDGLMVPVNDRYADQRKVFSDLGQDVLNNAYKGFNCSLFAYGQTGSGKSYSIVGFGQNRGIVPITCDEIFQHIGRSTNEKNEFRVTLQMLEIYNEQVRDLLSRAPPPKGGLKVRNVPKLGVQVMGLSEVPVLSYQEIEARMDEGTSNRTIAATNMNATSSRAHTVVTIMFTHIEKGGRIDGKDKEVTSKINLVDLAGSERADSTGATGDRLKEGSAINLSLTMLGNVITALAERSMNPNKKILIPYRDSKLTQILQDALGGNSKTIMIAALSPADINYDETLSTLRYADRAKKIKNKAVVNVDPKEALIAKLREENAKLLAALQELQEKGFLTSGPDSGVVAPQMSSEEREKLRKDMQEMAEEVQENQKLMENQEKSWDQKVAEAQKTFNASQIPTMKESVNKRQTTPYISNINEDPMLSGKVLFFLEGSAVTVGRKDSKPEPKIAFSGVSIQGKHAVLNRSGNTYSLTAYADARVMVNGKQVPANQAVDLHNNDRIMFGTNHLFQFFNPKEGTKEAPSGWESAQEELARHAGFDSQKHDQALYHEITHILPLVMEANMISKELDKGVVFDAKLITKQHARGALQTSVSVEVLNPSTGNTWLWSKDKFLNRSFLMREMYQNHVDFETVDLPQARDPFWDPIEAVLIGTATCYLSPLSHVIEYDSLVDIKDYKGEHQGVLQVGIFPCTTDGTLLGEDSDMFVEDPNQLLGKRLDFLLKIPYARGLPPRFIKGYHCRYTFLNFNEDRTQLVSDTVNPEFRYERHLSIPKVKKDTLRYLRDGVLQVEVWGEPPESVKPTSAKTGNDQLQSIHKKGVLSAAGKGPPGLNNADSNGFGGLNTGGSAGSGPGFRLDAGFPPPISRNSTPKRPDSDADTDRSSRRRKHRSHSRSRSRLEDDGDDEARAERRRRRKEEKIRERRGSSNAPSLSGMDADEDSDLPSGRNSRRGEQDSSSLRKQVKKLKAEYYNVQQKVVRRQKQLETRNGELRAARFRVRRYMTKLYQAQAVVSDAVENGDLSSDMAEKLCDILQPGGIVTFRNAARRVIREARSDDELLS